MLVTGAAGFIGSHLCEVLLAHGHEVFGVDAFVGWAGRAELEANLAPMIRRDRFRFRELDLRTAALDTVVAGADAVIHEAALPGLVRSWTDFEAYVGCNVVATQRLLEAWTAAPGRPFILGSTSSVYGADAVGDETLPTEPVSPYGITKLAAEHLVRAYGRVHDFPHVILRYFSIYGPRQRPDMAYRIFIELLARGEPIDVFGDGEQSRSNTYVDDCVEATVAALERRAPAGTYNIGGGEPITLNGAIRVMSEELGVAPAVRYLPPRPGDQRRTLAACARARDAFGFEPSTGPVEGLRRQIAWCRARASE